MTCKAWCSDSYQCQFLARVQGQVSTKVLVCLSFPWESFFLQPRKMDATVKDTNTTSQSGFHIKAHSHTFLYFETPQIYKLCNMQIHHSTPLLPSDFYYLACQGTMFCYMYIALWNSITYVASQAVITLNTESCLLTTQ